MVKRLEVVERNRKWPLTFPTECHVKENPDKKAKKKQRIRKSFKNSNICKRATTLEQTIWSKPFKFQNFIASTNHQGRYLFTFTSGSLIKQQIHLRLLCLSFISLSKYNLAKVLHNLLLTVWVNFKMKKFKKVHHPAQPKNETFKWNYALRFKSWEIISAII